MDEHLGINLSLLRRDSHTRFMAIKQIREACRTYGFFNVINHGIDDSVIEDALDVNARFFEMDVAEKEELISDDVWKAVRFEHVNGDYSREFLKLYAHPFEHFISFWPSFPGDYRSRVYEKQRIVLKVRSIREKMGIYSREARKVCIELFGAIMESLSLDQTHLKQHFEQGIQILGVNCNHPCSESSTKKNGSSPHTDHSIITLLLQSAPGLEFMDPGGSWKGIPGMKGSLQVLVGDHLEVISNGLYKSVLHRASNSSCDNVRVSIASFHSLGMDEIVEPAAEIERGENRRRYEGSSLRDFLKHIASRDAGAFIERLKIDEVDS